MFDNVGRLTQVVCVIDRVPKPSSTRLLPFLRTLGVTFTVRNLAVRAKGVVTEALSSELSSRKLVSCKIKLQSVLVSTRICVGRRMPLEIRGYENNFTFASTQRLAGVDSVLVLQISEHTCQIPVPLVDVTTQILRIH